MSFPEECRNVFRLGTFQEAGSGWLMGDTSNLPQLLGKGPQPDTCSHTGSWVLSAVSESQSWAELLLLATISQAHMCISSILFEAWNICPPERKLVFNSRHLVIGRHFLPSSFAPRLYP